MTSTLCNRASIPPPLPLFSSRTSADGENPWLPAPEWRSMDDRILMQHMGAHFSEWKTSPLPSPQFTSPPAQPSPLQPLHAAELKAKTSLGRAYPRVGRTVKPTRRRRKIKRSHVELFCLVLAVVALGLLLDDLGTHIELLRSRYIESHIGNQLRLFSLCFSISPSSERTIGAVAAGILTEDCDLLLHRFVASHGLDSKLGSAKEYIPALDLRSILDFLAPASPPTIPALQIKLFDPVRGYVGMWLLLSGGGVLVVGTVSWGVWYEAGMWRAARRRIGGRSSRFFRRGTGG